MKTFLPWTLALLASIAAIHFWREGQALQSRLAALNTEISSERTRNQEELERLKSRQTEAEKRYRTDTQELLKLRDQARLSREQSAELERARQEVQRLQTAQRITPAANSVPEPSRPAQAAGSFPREQWTFAGYQTPEAALVSAIWAMKEGNPNTYLQSLAPAEQERVSRLWADKTESDIIAKHQSDVSRITGFQILGSDISSDSEIVLNVEIQGVGRKEQVNMQKVGGEWKFGGFIRK